MALDRDARHRVIREPSFSRVLVGAAMIAMSLPAFATTGAASERPVTPHLQFRPVLATVPPTAAATTADASSKRAVASCDRQTVASLGQAVATTKAADADPETCVVLPAGDGNGSRYLLGKSALDGTSVKRAKATFSSGNGWALTLTLSPTGSRAFDALAQAQFHQQIAVLVDGVVSSTPVILPSTQTFSSFNGSVQINVGDSSRQAKQLAKSISRWRHTG